jgi:hypothetical protein
MEGTAAGTGHDTKADMGEREVPGSDGRGDAERIAPGRTLEPDVLVDLPKLQVEEVGLAVRDLQASVTLHANVLNLLQLNVGAQASLGGLELTVKGVEVQAQVKVRLDDLAAILDRVLTTIDRNPQIVERLVAGIGQAVEQVGQGAGRAVGEVGEGASGALQDVGRGAGSALGEVGRGAGEAVGDVGEGARSAVQDVGQGARSVAENAGEGAGSAVRDVGHGARSVSDDVAEAAQSDTQNAGQAAQPDSQNASQAPQPDTEKAGETRQPKRDS